MNKLLLGGASAALILSGCAAQPGSDKTLKGAGAGAVIGGGLGALAGGNDTRNVAIGAVVGAIAGGAVGAYMDRQEEKLRQQTAGTGIEVDRNGDQIELRLPSDVTFAVNESDIQSQFYPALNDVAATLTEYPSTAVDVIGHADSTGSDSYNQALSERRANSVRGYLIGQGVQDVRIVASGRGETQPIASNDTAAGRAQNRRVQIILTPVTDG